MKSPHSFFLVFCLLICGSLDASGVDDWYREEALIPSYTLQLSHERIVLDKSVTDSKIKNWKGKAQRRETVDRKNNDSITSGTAKKASKRTAHPEEPSQPVIKTTVAEQVLTGRILRGLSNFTFRLRDRPDLIYRLKAEAMISQRPYSLKVRNFQMTLEVHLAGENPENTILSPLLRVSVRPMFKKGKPARYGLDKKSLDPYGVFPQSSTAHFKATDALLDIAHLENLIVHYGGELLRNGAHSKLSIVSRRFLVPGTFESARADRGKRQKGSLLLDGRGIALIDTQGQVVHRFGSLKLALNEDDDDGGEVGLTLADDARTINDVSKSPNRTLRGEVGDTEDGAIATSTKSVAFRFYFKDSVSREEAQKRQTLIGNKIHEQFPHFPLKQALSSRR